MERRRFIVVLGCVLVGTSSAIFTIQKYTSKQAAATYRALSGKWEKFGFSIKCALAATEGRIAVILFKDTASLRVNFGQVMVDRYFVNEIELTEAKRLLNK